MKQMHPKIIFTKKNLSGEPRRSHSLTDAHLKDLREGVITASRISSFYHDHIERARQSGRDPMIMPRDAIQILTQMRGQKVYICEERRDGEKITHASSMLWDEELPVQELTDPTTFRIERFLEIGTPVSELPGFGLQWILTAVTVVEQLLYDPTGTIYAATYGNNDVAGPNFTKNMFFVRWNSVPQTLVALRNYHLQLGGEISRGVNWFRPTIKTVVEAARLIIDLVDRPQRTAKSMPGGPKTETLQQIEFIFDKTEFKKVPFGEMIQLCRDLTRNPPTDFESLRSFSSRTLSRNFIYTGDREYR